MAKELSDVQFASSSTIRSFVCSSLRAVQARDSGGLMSASSSALVPALVRGEGVELKEAEHISLLQNGDTWLLGNHITQELQDVTVYAAGCDLEAGIDDDDGYCIAPDSGQDAQPIRANDIFYRSLFQATDGRVYMTDKKTGRTAWLCEAFGGHGLLTITLQADSFGHKRELHAARFMEQWEGFQLWWSLPALLPLLGITGNPKYLGRWVSSKMMAAETLLSKWGVSLPHALRSRRFAGKEQAGPLSTRTRVLPYPALSTYMLVMLLARFAAGEQNSNGLKAPAQSAAAEATLRAVLAPMRDLVIDLNFFFDQAWIWNPPVAGSGESSVHCAHGAECD